MAASLYTVYRSKHATLSTTVPDTIYFTKENVDTLAVTNRDSSTTLYFTEYPANEVQTITLSAGLATQTFKLTWSSVESSAAVTIPTGGYANVTAAQIATCLATITGITSADVSVVKSSNDYAVTFQGALRGADVGAITITSKTGAADGSVAETTKGGAVSAAAGTYVVLPLQTKAIPLPGFYIVSVIGSGNAYSVEVF